MIKGWTLATGQNGQAHAVPVGDLKEHVDEGCSCNPKEDEVDLMIHNSFDGREATEETIN
jgi:hypothetical protein